jgi:hypothetical protein
VFKHSAEGVLCYQDELSGWFGANDKYTGKGTLKDRGFWLRTYNGGCTRDQTEAPPDRGKNWIDHTTCDRPYLACADGRGLFCSAVPSLSTSLSAWSRIPAHMLVGALRQGGDNANCDACNHRNAYRRTRISSCGGEETYRIGNGFRVVRGLRKEGARYGPHARPDRPQ